MLRAQFYPLQNESFLACLSYVLSSIFFLFVLYDLTVIIIDIGQVILQNKLYKNAEITGPRYPTDSLWKNLIKNLKLNSEDR